jgi:hypothetical protein
MLGDPTAEPSHFFLIHFPSLNLDWPLHGLSLLSIESVVQLFFALIGDAPAGKAGGEKMMRCLNEKDTMCRQP